MKRLTFAPGAPNAYENPIPHYEALEQAADGLSYGDPIEPSQLRLVSDMAHLALVSEIHYSPGSTSCSVPIEHTKSQRRGNCVGLSYALSIMLQNAGVRHDLGYAAGHAFLIAPTIEGDYIVDPIEERMLEPFMAVPDGDETPTRRLVRAFFNRHLAPEFTQDEDSFKARDPNQGYHPWQDIPRNIAIRSRLADSVEGREALTLHQRVERSIIEGRFRDALTMITKRGDRLPEYESDPRYNEIIGVIKAQLVKSRGQLSKHQAMLLTDIVETYLSTLPEDGFTEQARGDLMFELGRSESGRRYLFRSRDAYLRGQDMEGGSYLPEKVRKVTAIIQK